MSSQSQHLLRRNILIIHVEGPDTLRGRSGSGFISGLETKKDETYLGETWERYNF